MSRSELVQNHPAVLVDTVFVYRCGNDSSHHHEPSAEPLFGPLDLAFKMAFILRDARRFYSLRWQRREPSFFQLVDAGRESKAQGPDLFQDLAIERRNIQDKLIGRDHVSIGVFVRVDAELNTRWLVMHPYAGRKRCCVDAANCIDRGYRYHASDRDK